MNKHSPHIPQIKHGFTIIEIIIVTSIVSIIFVVVANFVLDGLRVQTYVSEQNDAVVEARKALKSMVGELREAVNADTGAYPLELTAPYEIIFYGDIDNDDYIERIRYFLEDVNLKKGVIEPSGDPLAYQTANEVTSILATYIRNTDTDTPLFTYYNENYPQDTTNNPLIAPIDKTVVRMVNIHLLINVDLERVPDTRELNVTAHLRNLKENF